MPVAMPVCSGGDALDDEVHHRGEGEAGSRSEQRRRHDDLPRMPVLHDQPHEPCGGGRRADDQRHARAELRRQAAAQRARHRDGAGPRHQVEPRRARPRRRSRPCWSAPRRARGPARTRCTCPSPRAPRRRWSSTRPGCFSICRSTSGTRRALLHVDPRDQQHHRRHEQHDDPRRRPAPGGALADRDEQADEPSGEQQRGRPGDASVALPGSVGYHEVGGDPARHDDHERDPEQPVVGEVLEDRSGEHDPEHAAASEHGRHPRRPARHVAPVELVADDPEGEREDRPAEALHRPRDDHHGEGGGERSDEDAERECGERGQEDPSTTEHVAEPARERRRDGRREQERGEDPRRAGRGRVEPELERRERRDDQRLHERVAAAGEDEDAEEQAAARRTVAALPHARSFVLDMAAAPDCGRREIVLDIVFQSWRGGCADALRKEG